MGLEIVEIILDIEEKLKITIHDGQLSNVSTAGGLHAIAYAGIRDRLSSPARCANVIVFHRLRKALMEEVGLVRREIRPSLGMGECMPMPYRPAIWRRLEEGLALSLPSLHYPRILAITCFALVFIVIASCFTMISLQCSSWVMKLGLPLLSPVFSFFILAMAERILHSRLAPLRNQIPPGFKTLEDLVQKVVQLNAGKIAEETGAMTEEECWESVRGIIADVGGLRPEQVKRESRLVQDLGLG